MTNFAPLKEYERIAGIMCNKMGINPSFEEIGIVAEYIIKADMKYNPEIGSQIGFRSFYARFGVKHCIKLRRKDNKSKNPIKNDLKNLHTIDNFDDFFYNELEVEDSILINQIADLFNSGKYQICYKYYIESKTFEEIAKELGCSRQNCHQKIKVELERLHDELVSKA